jgi:glutamyl-tRNA synthetase
LSEIVSYVDFLFLDEPTIDEAAWAKAAANSGVLPDVIAGFEALPDWSADGLKEKMIAIGERHQLKLGKAQAPVRVAVTGRAVGLPLFESSEVLGRERTLSRLRMQQPPNRRRPNRHVPGGGLLHRHCHKANLVTQM